MSANTFETVLKSASESGFYSQLGKFITAYALAEVGVYLVARKLAGVNEAKGRILFSGMRLGDVQTRTRGLLANSRYSTKTRNEIDECLKQIDQIGLVRDKIVHRFTSFDGVDFHISNFLTAKSLANAERDVVSREELSAMEMDCWAIYFRLLHIWNPDLRRQTQKDVLAYLRQPWRYKPPQRRTPKKPSRKHKALAEALLQQRASQT